MKRIWAAALRQAMDDIKAAKALWGDAKSGPGEGQVAVFRKAVEASLLLDSASNWIEVALDDMEGE